MMSSQNPRILVVDDEQDTCANLSDILADVGYQVDVAYDGPSALDLVRRNAYDVALLDLKMPGMDGLEATRLIRQMPEFVDLPIVFLTAKAMRGDRENSLKAGASGYITKPVNPDKLLAHICHHLRKPTETPVNS